MSKNKSPLAPQSWYQQRDPNAYRSPNRKFLIAFVGLAATSTFGIVAVASGLADTVGSVHRSEASMNKKLTNTLASAQAAADQEKAAQAKINEKISDAATGVSIEAQTAINNAQTLNYNLNQHNQPGQTVPALILYGKAIISANTTGTGTATTSETVTDPILLASPSSFVDPSTLGPAPDGSWLGLTSYDSKGNIIITPTPFIAGIDTFTAFNPETTSISVNAYSQPAKGGPGATIFDILAVTTNNQGQLKNPDGNDAILGNVVTDKK